MCFAVQDSGGPGVTATCAPPKAAMGGAVWVGEWLPGGTAERITLLVPDGTSEAVDPGGRRVSPSRHVVQFVVTRERPDVTITGVHGPVRVSFRSHFENPPDRVVSAPPGVTR